MAAAKLDNFLAHNSGAFEIGRDEAVSIEPKMLRQSIRQGRLAPSRKPRQLALVPPHAKAARRCRETIGGREAVMCGPPSRQQAVGAVSQIKAAFAQHPNRVA